jgi:hypothetical protein
MPPVTIDGTNGITTPMYSGAISANAVTPVNSFKNRIINGNMSVDQRNAGASVTPADGAYTLDRWVYLADQASKCTIQQNAGSVTPPAGFSNYLGVTSTAATTITTSQQFSIIQRVEGFNMLGLNWGSANAQTVTLSFWVRSSLTGTFGGVLRNDAGDYNYPFSYTISSANTWEQKSVTITGATTGTWTINNGRCLQIAFSLGAGATLSGTAGAWTSSNFWSVTGATQVLATNGATFYITGVQLEVGSTATSFDYRPYGTEFALCQRYYYLHASGNGAPVGNAANFSASSFYGILQFPVQMRIGPTISVTTGTDYYIHYRNSSSDGVNSLSQQGSSPTAFTFFNNTQVSGTGGNGGWVECGNASSFVAFGAEL